MVNIQKTLATVREAVSRPDQEPPARESEEVDASETERPTIGDRWANGLEAGRQRWDEVRGQLEEKGGLDDRLEEVVYRGVGDLLEVFDPSMDDLKALGRVVQGIDGAVSEAVEGYSARVNQLSLSHAVSEFSDLSARVGHRIQEMDRRLGEKQERLEGEFSQISSQVGEQLRAFDESSVETQERLERELNLLGIKASEQVVSRVNSCLNAVGAALGGVVVERQESLEAAAQGVQNFDEWLGKRDAIWDTLDAFTNVPGLAETSMRFGIQSWAGALEVAPEVGDYLANSPLLGHDNFDEWLGEIDAGSTRQLGLGFGVHVVKLLGGSVESGREMSVTRSESDPNQIILSLKDETGATVEGGTSIQGQGISAGSGVETSKEVQFQFDLRCAEERQLLRSALLSSQIGMPSSRLIAAMGDQFQSVSTAGGAQVLAHGELAWLSGEITHGVGGMHTLMMRGDDMIDRYEFGYETNVELSKSIGQMPDDFFEDIKAQTDDEWVNPMAMHLSGLPQGQIGPKGAVSAEVVAGVELNEGRLERLVAGMELDAQAFGHRGTVEVDMVVHRPDILAAALETTPEDIYDSLKGGDLRFEELSRAARTMGLEPEEVLGLRIGATTVESDGFQVSLVGVEAQDTMERHRSREIWSYGAPIDGDSSPGDEELAEEVAARRSGQTVPC